MTKNKPTKGRFLKIILGVIIAVVIIGVLTTVTLIGIGYSVYKSTSYDDDTDDAYSPGYGSAETESGSSFLSASDNSILADKETLTESEIAEDSSVDQTTTDTTTEVTEQKIIKTATLSVTADITEDVVLEINKLAEVKGGYTDDSYTYTTDKGYTYSTVIIRVPVDEFETAIKIIKDVVSDVTSESISGQDVTEDYVDLQAQLKNYQTEESRLLTFIEQAENVDDLLKIETKLSSVRASIERTQGKIKYLENKTDLATVTVYVSEDVSVTVPTDEWKPLTTIKQAWHSLIVSLQGIADILIWLSIIVLPIILILWFIFWLIYRFIKTLIKRKNK
ncbi:MAG: DUF4349 domain-containing protein [bacterium]